MSLKLFHMLFIACSALLGLLFAFWGFLNYAAVHAVGYLLTAIGSLIATVALIVYGINFQKKIAKI